MLGHCSYKPARLTPVGRGQVVEVSYNVQAAVDDKHKLVVATHVINKNDRNALHDIASEAKENLHSDGFTVLADKGYHNGRELQDCQNNGIQTIVAPSEIVNSNKFGTTEEYLVTKFTYNPDNDTYTCPQGSTLTSTGTWHKKTRERDHHLFKKYRTPDCKTCPVKHLCTGRKDGGREIERSEYAEAVEANLKNLQGNKELYKRRQMIIEHIYGTAKRKWGFNFTDLRGLEKVNGEFALIMTVYNLKRTINILGIPELLQLIQNWKPDYKRVSLALKSSLFGLIKALLAFKTLISKTNELNLKLTQVQDYLYTNPLYASEMRFFQKTESFFTA
jgi:radical SAM protein with 4Fe4S-binding SPASM domain